jgi:hypothetical protein
MTFHFNLFKITTMAQGIIKSVMPQMQNGIHNAWQNKFTGNIGKLFNFPAVKYKFPVACWVVHQDRWRNISSIASKFWYIFRHLFVLKNDK